MCWQLFSTHCELDKSEILDIPDSPNQLNIAIIFLWNEICSGMLVSGYMGFGYTIYHEMNDKAYTACVYHVNRFKGYIYMYYMKL